MRTRRLNRASHGRCENAWSSLTFCALYMQITPIGVSLSPAANAATSASSREIRSRIERTAPTSASFQKEYLFHSAVFSTWFLSADVSTQHKGRLSGFDSEAEKAAF